MDTNILNSGILGFSLVPESDIVLSTHISHAMLGAITRDMIVLKTPLGKLSGDGMFMTVGGSGTHKTLPLLKSEYIARDLNIIVPSKFTTESLGEYFYKVDDKKQYVHNYYGIIYWDEASKYFSESGEKKFLNGMIEAMSSIHNHILPYEYYRTYSTGKPQNPYVSLLGNMVPHYLNKIPEYFWNQGLAGRIMWRYIPPSKPLQNTSWLDFDSSDKSRNNLDMFSDTLKNINEIICNLKKPMIVTVDEEADQVIQEFKYNIEMEWYNNYIENPFDIDFAYKKRITELLGKTSLRFGIGRYYAEHTKFDGFEKITKNDVDFALEIVNDSIKDLKTIFNFVDLSKLSKEEIHKRNKRNAILRYLGQGFTYREVQQKVSNYKDGTPFKDHIQELLSNKLIELKDKEGHYNVL